MEIGMKKTVNVNAKTLKMCCKCSDRFSATLHDSDDQIIADYEGYVPDFFPGQHYGDYVELEINIDSGQIVNWVKPRIEQIEKFINGSEEDDG